MKKMLPILIVVVLLGVGAFAFLGKGKGENGTSTSVEQQTKTQKFSGLKAVATLGTPLKCSYQIEGNEYEGYIKGKNYRGKMKSANGQVGEVIMKDNCMWSWTSEQPQGIKLCFEPEEGEDSIWDQEDTSGLEYNCVPAVITDNKFTPPANIEFLDMNQGFDPTSFGVSE